MVIEKTYLSVTRTTDAVLAVIRHGSYNTEFRDDIESVVYLYIKRLTVDVIN